MDISINAKKIVWNRRNFIVAGVIGALALSAMLVIILRKPALVASEQVAEVELVGWKAEFLGEFAGAAGKEFSGFKTVGKVLYVPAGAEFSLTAQPANVHGELECVSPTPETAQARSSWDAYGGKLNVGTPTPSGTRQLARAPMQSGLYRFVWRASTVVPIVPAAASVNNAPIPAPTPKTLDVLVLAQATSETRGERTVLKVNGKSIGGYHDPLKAPVKRVRENAAQYQVPKYFATLNAESVRLKLGPNFELGQLVAFKDYVGADGKKVYTNERHTDVFPLRPELIEKLIKLRELLRQKGVPVTRFGVTSAFRTPDYNKQIGGALFSRHCYGDAVDLYIDEDGNHKMDDLNGDGKVDRKDGLIIANACRELELSGAVVPGGIGVYEWDGDESVRSHVHIDCRGYISRWGQIGSGKYKKSFKWWPAAEFQDEENGE